MCIKYAMSNQFFVCAKSVQIYNTTITKGTYLVKSKYRILQIWCDSEIQTTSASH